MPPKYTFGKSDGDLNNQQWFHSGMETHGSAILINNKYPEGKSLGIMKNNKSKTHGCEHAEDVFIRTIKEDVGALSVSPAVNKVILCISKSPCSSTYGTSNKPVGCAEELINFQNTIYKAPINGNEYVFKVIVLARGVYKQSTGSHNALDLMRDNGIDVATDVHRKKDGSSMKKEYDMEI